MIVNRDNPSIGIRRRRRQKPIFVEVEIDFRRRVIIGNPAARPGIIRVPPDRTPASHGKQVRRDVRETGRQVGPRIDRAATAPEMGRDR